MLVYVYSKAMKIQDKFETNEENEEKIHISPELGEVALKELREMRHIHHENVVRYFDDFEERFHGMEFFCVVTEYFEVRQIYRESLITSNTSK